MKIDKYFHLYGEKDGFVFEEIEPGKWTTEGNRAPYRCSNCDGKTPFEYDLAYGYVPVFSPFCPWCGARMEN